jgi:hypothetical protein
MSVVPVTGEMFLQVASGGRKVQRFRQGANTAGQQEAANGMMVAIMKLMMEKPGRQGDWYRRMDGGWVEGHGKQRK